MDSHRDPATEDSTSLGSNTTVEASTTSTATMTLTTTNRQYFPIFDLPVEIIIQIISEMTHEQRMLVALTNQRFREIYNKYLFDKEPELWERRIANLIYLARDNMSVVACNGRPQLHQINLDVDDPWNHDRVNPCDRANPGSYVASGVRFGGKAHVRNMYLETILKFVLHYDSLDTKQRQFLAKLLTPQSLPEGPYFAIHAPPPNIERNWDSLVPQGPENARALMDKGYIEFWKVERDFGLRVVMKKDKDAEGGLAPAVVAKLAYSLKKVSRDEIKDNTRFDSMRICRHRSINSALHSVAWTPGSSFNPTDLHFNEFVAKKLDNSGEQLEWTCRKCATWFAIDSQAQDTMTVTVLADLGGQGLPFSNEWLSHTYDTVREWTGGDFNRRDLGVVFERDRWVAPDSK